MLHPVQLNRVEKPSQTKRAGKKCSAVAVQTYKGREPFSVILRTQF